MGVYILSAWTPKVCYKRVLIYLIIASFIFMGFSEADGIVNGDTIPIIISSNDIIFNDVKITGDIILTNMTIRNKLVIENSEINGSIVFDGSQFMKQVSFSDTTILGQSSFISSTFNHVAKFKQTNFIGRANYKKAAFMQGEFDRAVFYEDAIFKYCTFINEPTFTYASFNKDALFTSSAFNGGDFNHGSFYKNVFFNDATFQDKAYFNYAIMSNIADFSNAKFSNMMSLNDSRFMGYADFYNTTFAGDAYFSDLKASNEVDFSKSNFSKMADFHDARFSGYANFKNASFRNLFLSGALFNQFYLPWKNVKGKLDCDEYLYLRMISTYKDLGLFDDADDCYYYFKHNYLQSYQFSNFIEPILGELYGWGVKPINTIKWSLIFILVFGLFFWFPYILTDTNLVKGRPDLSITKPSECSPNSTVQSIGKDSTDLHAASFSCVVSSIFLSLILSLIFSARIFASALTSTIEGPSLKGSGSNIAKLEKLLAHIMAFLFLIAISKTILREII